MIPPQLQTSQDLTEDERKAQPLIMIGGSDRNQAAADVPEGDLASLSPAAYSEAPEGPTGILTLGSSPWAEDQPILFVAGSGNDGEAVVIAARALGSASTLLEMQGTGIVVPTVLPPQEMMGAEPANSAPAELAPYVIPDERPWIERVPAWQVAGAILFITLLVLLVGFVLLRWVRAGAR